MRTKYFLTLFVIILLFSSCGKTDMVYNDYIFDTFISVRVTDTYRQRAREALESVSARLFEIENIASAANPESELSYVNQNAFNNDVAVSDELFYLLVTGLYYSQLTNGEFDITLGALINLWGDMSVPAENQIALALENSGYANLILNIDNRTVRFLKEGLKLDLGAMAKGYAADEAKRVLASKNVDSAIIDLGGDILAFGDNGGKGWLVGIVNPLKTSETCIKIRVPDKAVVTSGDYERYFIENDKKYHHIINSKTGFPSDSGIISATIISDSAAEADALSTAFFVMGAEKAVVFAKGLFNVEYVLIDSDLNFIYSENLDIEIAK